MFVQQTFWTTGDRRFSDPELSHNAHGEQSRCHGRIEAGHAGSVSGLSSLYGHNVRSKSTKKYQFLHSVVEASHTDWRSLALNSGYFHVFLR